MSSEVPPQPGMYIQPNLPSSPAGNWAKIWVAVGPAGVLGILAAMGGMFLMYTLHEGQQVMQKSQDNLFRQLQSEQKDSQQREEKLLDRADRLNKDMMDRWEKARERSEEVRSEVKAISTKVDGVAQDVKAVNVYLRLQPKDPKEK